MMQACTAGSSVPSRGLGHQRLTGRGAMTSSACCNTWACPLADPAGSSGLLGAASWPINGRRTPSTASPESTARWNGCAWCAVSRRRPANAGVDRHGRFPCRPSCPRSSLELNRSRWPSLHSPWPSLHPDLKPVDTAVAPVPAHLGWWGADATPAKPRASRQQPAWAGHRATGRSAVGAPT
jgi:hypothetical protein